MANAEEEFQKKFEILRQSYVAKMGDRLSDLEAHAAKLAGSVDDKTIATQEILQGAHKLAGNAATFGFTELGSDAATLEQCCEDVLKKSVAGDEDYEDIAARVLRLRDHLGD